MKAWQRISDFVREHLSSVGLMRLARRGGIAADRAIESTMERVPVLRRLDELAPPPQEADLLKTTVNDMPGKEWVNKIADQAERMQPPSYPSGPQRRGH